MAGVLLCCGKRARWLAWLAGLVVLVGLVGLVVLVVLVGCLGGWLACEQAVGWWRVTGVCVASVWWVAVCLVLVGYDYGGEPINIAYQFSVFWNQAGSAYPQLSTRYPQGKCVYKR